ncbi:MAG: hypothetical protein SGARI_001955, partial [Bacillariaceae sp.]
MEHLRMSRQGNCRVWIASWFGIDSREDITLQETVLDVLESDPDQRIAIHYETNAVLRYKDGDGNIFHTLDGKPDDPDDGVANHMIHFCNNYFNHPNYYFVQGNRPVIFLYLSRVLDNGGQLNKIDEQETGGTWDSYEFLEEVVKTMRDTAIATCQMDPFIVGDHVFNAYLASRDAAAFQLLDAVTGYDVYGHLDDGRNGFAGEELESFMEEQAKWKDEANKENCAYIPTVTPGFNDRGFRLRTSGAAEAMSLSRKLTEEASEGSLLAKSIELSLGLLDPAADNLMALTSFNEYHEDTQIEPLVVDRMSRAMVIAADGTQDELEAQKVTKMAHHIWNNERTEILDPPDWLDPDDDLTQGLDYEAYYDLYLNILRSTTLAPFFEEHFESTEIEGALFNGARKTTLDPAVDGFEGSSLELVYDSTGFPSWSINLGSLDYNFVVIDFMFYSERSEANENLVVRCFEDNDGLLGEPLSSETWEFGREYKEHRKAFYAVTECNLSTVTSNHEVVVEIAYESLDSRTSMIVDAVKISGLAEATNGVALQCDSDDDCRENFCD